MRAEISPNRISISDRYPMLGFTIRSHGQPQLAEVTLVTDPALLSDKSQRSTGNFFSTASMGPLQIADGEAVYIVPAEVLARFVGSERLYFALATKAADGTGPWEMQVRPDADSVFISLQGLTGRSLRRVRMFPNRNAIRTPGYGAAGEAGLGWAGDSLETPGSDPVNAPPDQMPSNGNSGDQVQDQSPEAPATPSAPYNDGFGELPPLPQDAEQASTAKSPDATRLKLNDADEEVETDEIGGDDANLAKADAAIAASLGVNQPAVRNVRIGERIGAQAPDTDSMGTAMRIALDALIATNPALSTTVAAIRLANARGLSVGIGPSVSGGFAAGGALGAGIIFAPDNKLGIYGVGELDLGAIFSLNATIQMTILDGDIDAFEGITFVAGFSAGEGIVGGGVAIFDSQSNFIGVSVEIGLGMGSPLEIYAGVQRGVAESLGFAVAFGHDPVRAASLLGVNSDPYTVEVKYRMFIPSPAISGPFSDDYGGDGRGFSYSSGSSRGEIVAQVKLTPGMGIDRVRVQRRHWGESKAYDSDDTHAVQGKPGWWLGLRQGATPTESKTLRATNDNFNVVVGTSGRFAIQAVLENASVVSVKAEGAMPLSRVAPDIDADIAIFFRKRGGQIQVKAVGRHDGFPCHELYVNRKAVYRYDPVQAGNGPSSLAGWGDTEVATNWVNVASTSGAQSLGINESFTINWDDVQQIAQPTSMSCWAAAAAMVVGWRDQMSLSPNVIAEIVNRPIQKGLNLDDFDDLAEGLGLTTVAGQSFTHEGFRDLLEDNGPLWVGVALPNSLHAIVVTGLYNDENGNLMVRITDPWDRIVGTPGSPGSHKPTHQTGSRYIMTWEAFEAEYARMGATTSATFQILHAGGTHGHELNRGTLTPPPGYAASLGINESFTSNWDDVQKVAQPTNTSCWAAAAAMVVGWRDKISLSPRTLAEIVNRPVSQGLDPDDIDDLGQALGLVTVAGQSFTLAGFRALLEDNGPIWVGVALPGSLHAIVVTGLYTDEDGDLMVRVTDPWDRIVGTPGKPGSHKSTHRTGSRYIMTWDAFEAQYARMGASTSSHFQILHAGGTHGHQLNRGSAAPPPGYAAALSEAAAPATDVPAANGAPMAITLSPETAPIAPAIVLPMSGPNGVPIDQSWQAAVTEVLGAEHVAHLVTVPALAAEHQWTVAIGLDDAQGYGAPGVGIAPGGTIFRYGTEPAAKPALKDGPAQLLVTIAEGAPELFTQWTRAQAFSTEAGVTGAVLLNGSELPLALAMRLMSSATLASEIQAIAAAVAEVFAPNTDPVPATPTTPEPVPVAPQAPAQNGAPADAPSAMPPAAASALASVLEQVSSAPQPVPMPGGDLPSAGGTMPPLPGQPLQPNPQPNGDFPPPGVSIHRSNVNRNGVQYDLFLMDGSVMPEMPPAVQSPLIPGQQVVLDDWPYLDGPSGRSKGGVVLDWSYGGGAVANVRTAPGSPAARDGWAIAVHTDVGPGPENANEAKLKVTVRTTFAKEGEQPRTGVCCVILCGSGKHEVEHKDESPAAQMAMT